MSKFELHGGVRLVVTEGHSAEFVGDYDSGAVLWAASPPLARWLAGEGKITGNFDGKTGSDTVEVAGVAPSDGAGDGGGGEGACHTGDARSTCTHAVELGCGAGLVSLALAACGRHLQQVVATDGDAMVLESVTRPNFKANEAAVPAGVDLRAVPLNWGDMEAAGQLIEHELGGMRPQLIVGADVMYDREKHAALAQTIIALARPPVKGGNSESSEAAQAKGGAQAWSCRLLLAWEVRHIDHDEIFFPLLADVVLEGPRLVWSGPTPNAFAEYGVEDEGEIRIVECILGSQ